MSSCAACSAPFARINGRTIKDAIRSIGGRHHWSAAPIRNTQWFKFCETCDASKMSMVSNALPFLSSNGVMRTISNPNSPVVKIGVLETTIDALDGAIALNYQPESGIVQMEAKGRLYRALQSPTAADSLQLCIDVCKWGRGARVLGNLQRHYPGGALGNRVHEWLTTAHAMTPLDAIKAGDEIKGLGVSFASKHLRFLDPDRFAVLDDVLSLGLGYALNPVGYQLFMEQLAEFRDSLVAKGAPWRTLGAIEAGIFLLARQKVRSA